MTDDLAVRPIRFSNDVSAMRAFLELLGMSSRVESERPGWVDLVASAGMVALHDARTSDSGGSAGETRLSFEAADLDAWAGRLSEDGFDPAVWDETYGRVLSVVDGTGATVWVDGHGDDDYGYRRHAPRPDPRLVVQPIRFIDPDGPAASLLRALGLPALADAEPRWWVHDGGAGRVALHAPDGTRPPDDGRAGVDLAFVTSEPLADVRDRLRTAGYDATLELEAFGEVVVVTDPDGCAVTVGVR